jgi:hypothetical protein
MRARPWPVDVHVKLAPDERERNAVENFSIELRQQRQVSVFVRRCKHKHPAAFSRRKLSVIEVVTVECDERAFELARQAVMVAVARSTQVVMFHHEEHVPL